MTNLPLVFYGAGWILALLVGAAVAERRATRRRIRLEPRPVLYLADYQAPSNVIPIQRGEQL